MRKNVAGLDEEGKRMKQGLVVATMRQAAGQRDDAS
jgi:hypothetical protein